MARFQKYRAPRIVASQEGVSFWLKILLMILVICGVAWVAYQQGSAGEASGFAVLQPDAKRKITALEKERDQLRRELTMVKQAAEIDRESILTIRDQIKIFQDERLKMEEELAFLRGIVSTTSKKTALKVQNFRLEPGLETRQFHYKFSVSQVINSGIVAKGKIELSVEGLQDGRTKLLSLNQVSPDDVESIKMRFRFFQNVEGKLLIPEGFEPATINIEVKPSGKKLAPVKETFNWSPIS
ncbi:MAG: hypothetical protein KZQ75_03735 [Candidatus Thiodiazotropha sp. (ex Myrtea spinifera)]|nr:hypothetical protein [Candidatus Thiodiazotropha sp. (ex Myrtea spinifera)]MCU7828208.1 hypothetical protein [Candidatus Thiodiazotropha sp. (ex Myrtea sp. 'scaly one' KF741663)]